jgi:hypothetical protein
LNSVLAWSSNRLGAGIILLSSQAGATMNLTDRIEINSKVMLGKPVIRGTRVTVELILRKFSEGTTEASYSKPIPT